MYKGIEIFGSTILLKLTASTGTCFQQMLNIYLNFALYILTKLLNLTQENLVNRQDKAWSWEQYSCLPALPRNGLLFTKIRKR